MHIKSKKKYISAATFTLAAIIDSISPAILNIKSILQNAVENKYLTKNHIYVRRNVLQAYKTSNWFLFVKLIRFGQLTGLITSIMQWPYEIED